MKFKVRKINLYSFITDLLYLYNEGVEHIDISGNMSDKERDVIRIEESEPVNSSSLNLDGDITNYI